MSVAPVGSSLSQSSQTIGTRVLQQLLSHGSGTQAATQDLPGLPDDLMTLSPASKQLQQAPSEITQAMGDLFSEQKDVPGDLAKLRNYFQENPESLASVLSSMQGKLASYDASGIIGANQALLAALMKGQANGSEALNPVSLLLGMGNQDSLFTFMGDAGSDAASGPLSLLG